MADELGGAMVRWATVAWLVGLVAVLAAAWMERRSRRSGADAPAGSRVARHRPTYPRSWLQVLLGMTLIGNGAGMATHDPAGHDRRIGTAVMILGAVTVVVGTTGLLRQHRWGRRQGKGTIGAPPPNRGHSANSLRWAVRLVVPGWRARQHLPREGSGPRG